jgi:cytochrome c553
LSATESSAQNELTDSWGVKTGIKRHNTKGSAGVVFAHRAALVTCDKCHGRRLNFDGPHAPHLEHRAGRWMEVDCVGDEVHAS